MHQMENESGSPNTCIESSSSSTKNIIQFKPSYGRYCHIVKRADFDGYGFNLHSEKVKPGQYIGKVDANSPAEAAGLREGDQIIEVNGVNIGTETHKQVVQRIKAISNEVRLLLIDSTNDVASLNAQNQVNVPEKNTINTKISTSATTNPKSPSELLVIETSLPTIVPVTEAEEAGATVPPLDQKEYISSLSMVSTKSQSTNRNNPTDFGESTTNGHHAKPNGQNRGTIAITTVTTGLPASSVDYTDSTLRQNTHVSQNNETNNKAGLNLNLTAAAMRAKLLAKKKFDPKNETVDLKKKFDIIQKL